MNSVTRSYTVTGVDSVASVTTRTLDGEEVTVTRNVISAQMSSDDGRTIVIDVPNGTTHPFAPGARVAVTFSEE